MVILDLNNISHIYTDRYWIYETYLRISESCLKRVCWKETRILLFQYASPKGVIRIINYPKYVGMAVRAGRAIIELSTGPKCSSLGYICSNIIIRVWIPWRLPMASLSIQMFLDRSIAITRTHLVNYYQTVCHTHGTINLRILITLTRR